MVRLPSSGLTPLVCSVRRLKVQQLGLGQAVQKRVYTGGCQNYGPCLGTLNIKCHIRR